MAVTPRFSSTDSICPKSRRASDYRSALCENLVDDCAAGVKECWIVSPQAEMVEVLRLSAEGAETVEIYALSQTLTLATYPDLALAVESIFTL